MYVHIEYEKFSYTTCWYYIMDTCMWYLEGATPVIVSIPIGMCVIYKKVCRNILVEIDGGKMKWDFIPLHLDEFYATLEMDGLSHYRANINCFEK